MPRAELENPERSSEGGRHDSPPAGAVRNGPRASEVLAELGEPGGYAQTAVTRGPPALRRGSNLWGWSQRGPNQRCRQSETRDVLLRQTGERRGSPSGRASSEGRGAGGHRAEGRWVVAGVASRLAQGPFPRGAGRARPWGQAPSPPETLTERYFEPSPRGSSRLGATRSCCHIATPRLPSERADPWRSSRLTMDFSLVVTSPPYLVAPSSMACARFVSRIVETHLQVRLTAHLR